MNFPDRNDGGHVKMLNRCSRMKTDTGGSPHPKTKCNANDFEDEKLNDSCDARKSKHVRKFCKEESETRRDPEVSMKATTERDKS